MQTVIIADNSFVTRERAMLSRLEVGLADEGVRVVHAMPGSLRPSSADGSGLQSTIVRYQDAGLPFTRGRRAAELAGAIEAAADSPSHVDAVHAFGAGSWPIAIELARMTGAAILLELWRPGLLPNAAKAFAGCARGPRPVVPEFLVSESPLASALRERLPEAKVYSAPWGVHSPEHPRTTLPAREPGRTIAVAMLCDTGDPRRCVPALSGLLEAAGPGADVLIFAGVQAGPSSRESALWSAARKLGLLDRFSIVTDMESRREPILRMDLLMLPEACGRERTLTLEAMASGMPVIAAADEFLESLEDGRTARLVGGTNPASWAAAVRSILANAAGASQLIKSAHDYVRSKRSASGHVADILRAYQQAAKPSPVNG